MRPAANRRRRATESLASDRRRPPPTPTTDPQWPQLLSTPVPGRDSDASFTSSRPSTGGRPSTATSDRANPIAALRIINSYLAAQSAPFSLKHPLPSAKDITETLKLLLNRLGLDSQKLDEDIIRVLKFLKCPFKLNKSALRAPGTPHSWPTLLPVIHWLVQIINYKESTADSDPSFEEDKMFMYTLKSYLLYIRGEDEEMDALDEECIGEMREWRDKVEESVTALEENVSELEKKLEKLKREPSKREVLEKEKADLEGDVTKFHIMIEQLDGHLVDVQKKLEDKDGELDAKVEDRKRICEENEELRKKIEEQGINLRDADRMKRELQAVERDIEETEAARNDWEEKIWEMDSEISHKLKELEQLVMECNQTIRRLKLGNGFQYQLNAKGSTASEVMGLDYKSLLKPALASFVDDIKQSTMGKFEELISLRQQSGENAAELEEKRKHVAVLQSHIDEVEVELAKIRKETHEYASRCTAEARKLVEEIEMQTQKMSIFEKEAAELLKTSKVELQEIIMQTEEEVKLCALELFNLINSVSTHKEYMESKIAQVRNDLLVTAGEVADIYRRTSNITGQ